MYCSRSASGRSDSVTMREAAKWTCGVAWRNIAATRGAAPKLRSYSRIVPNLLALVRQAMAASVHALALERQQWGGGLWVWVDPS